MMAERFLYICCKNQCRNNTDLLLHLIQLHIVYLLLLRIVISSLSSYELLFLKGMSWDTSICTGQGTQELAASK